MLEQVHTGTKLQYPMTWLKYYLNCVIHNKNIYYFLPQSWNLLEKSEFCPTGKIASIECQTAYGVSSTSAGEKMQCTVEGGAVCLNSDNFPVPCSDYKIRYYCQCTGGYQSDGEVINKIMD